MAKVVCRKAKMPRWKLQKARTMRKDPTPSEYALYRAIRKRALGYRIRRQKPMFGYIADLYVPQAGLVIEVDGPIHDPAYDAKRDAHLARHGLVTLRFTNEQIQTNLPEVVASIKRAIEELLPG